MNQLILLCGWSSSLTEQMFSVMKTCLDHLRFVLWADYGLESEPIQHFWLSNVAKQHTVTRCKMLALFKQSASWDWVGFGKWMLFTWYTKAKTVWTHLRS